MEYQCVYIFIKSGILSWVIGYSINGRPMVHPCLYYEMHIYHDSRLYH